MKKEYILRGAFVLVSLFVLLGIILALSPVVSSKTTDYSYVEQNIEIKEDFEYSESTTSESCLNKIKDCNFYIYNLKEQVVDANTEKQAYDEIARVLEIKNQYLIDYNNLLALEAEEAKWQEKAAKYPEATRVWRYMKEEFGWNDELCAGIMGNIMAEIGGGTLNFSRWDWNTNTFGMIQWLGGRKRAIKAKYGEIATIEQQLDFMKDEMFGTNGVRKQITDKQLDAILNGESPEAIAYDFARYFERCSPGSYAPRRGYARKAYKFFVD